MKTKTKILLMLLAVGIVGLAVTMGYILGSNALMSREATKTYEVSEPYETVSFNTVLACADVQPSENGETRVETYAKAWLSHEIDMDSIVGVTVLDGVLTVTETAFPDDFLGAFPQPYELKLCVYLPQDVYEQWQGEPK